VRAAIEALQIPHIESDKGVLTVSIGVVESRVEAWQDLVKQADKALYQAKSQGRNQVTVADQL
ncbi:diguanylate cyclase, partial [Oleiphilus sp. HI0132]